MKYGSFHSQRLRRLRIFIFRLRQLRSSMCFLTLLIVPYGAFCELTGRRLYKYLVKPVNPSACQLTFAHTELYGGIEIVFATIMHARLP